MRKIYVLADADPLAVASGRQAKRHTWLYYVTVFLVFAIMAGLLGIGWQQRPALTPSSWSVFFVYKQSDGTDAFASLWTDDSVGAFDLVSIDLQRTGAYEVQFWGSPTTIFSGSISQGLRERWHTVSFTAKANGSGTVFYLSIDGAAPAVAVASSTAYAPLYRIDPSGGLDALHVRVTPPSS